MAEKVVDLGPKAVAIAGAGLAGSLLAVFLRNRGLNVHLFERRPDPRKGHQSAGRSINLALSDRGIKALKKVGVADEVLSISIPMYGRRIHAKDGTQNFQPYSHDGKQSIRSVSRGDLNLRLLECAEKRGAKVHFDKYITRFSVRTGEIHFQDDSKTKPETTIATDGAFSIVRRSIMNVPFFNFKQEYFAHGYKELCIPPLPNSTEHRLEKNCLHIWPRETHMMIALPNLDGSFTCTLFLPLKGKSGFCFEDLKTKEDVDKFFKDQFPDAVPLMPTLIDDFFTNPTGALMTVHCFPWSVDGRLTLLGDACHALVPFFGQGMNSAFEDVDVLDDVIEEICGKNIDQNIPWDKIYDKYQNLRKTNTDAIGQMAIENYIEMRDKVADKVFVFRNKVAAKLGTTFPNRFKSRYEMVSFSSIPYSEALRLGGVNDSLIDELTKGMTELDQKKFLEIKFF